MEIYQQSVLFRGVYDCSDEQGKIVENQLTRSYMAIRDYAIITLGGISMAEHNNLTKYYEEIAKEKLACFVDERFKLLELKDKPDLQSEELDIGIEVTRCLNKEDGVTDAFDRETISSNMPFEERKEKMQNMHASGVLYQSNDGKVIGHCLFQDLKKKMWTIRESIKEKGVKSKDYKKFKTNCLYLFVNMLFDEYRIKETINGVADNSFDFLFIDCVNGIYVYSSKTQEMTFYEFPDEKLTSIIDPLKWKYHIGCRHQISETTNERNKHK